MKVTSPKTEHHAGKDSRTVPLFPELRPFLEEANELATEGAEYLVERYRKGSMGPKGWRNCNLRTQFERIIKRAGLEPWPRLFHNLRASRETELAARFPIHVVAAWLENTPEIARKHYLLTTDEHFQRALEPGAPDGAANPTVQRFCSALQNPVQSGAVKVRNEPYETRENARKCEIPGVRGYGETDGEGFEPPVEFLPLRFSRPMQ